MSFGEILKNLRTAAGLTQQQLADSINLSKANVSKYESDLIEPNLETLRLITRVFNVNSDCLLEIKTNSSNQTCELIDTKDTLSLDEKQLIKKYRLLDTYGQKAVNSVLDIESDRYSNTKAELVQIPYVARSETGERSTIERTQEEIDDFLSKLKPDTSGQY